MIYDVVVAVPSNGEWKSQMGTSLALMTAKFLREGKQARRLHIHNTESSMLVMNRHQAVRDALRMKATHVLFVDSDMKFPPDALDRLLAHEKDFVAANCTRRSFPVEGTAYDFEGKLVDSREKKGIEKVRQVGLAFALVKCEVLKRLRLPLFMMEWIPDVMGYCGEDIYFTQRLQEAGVDLWVDHDLSKEIGHVGGYVFGWGHVGNPGPGDWRVK